MWFHSFFLSGGFVLGAAAAQQPIVKSQAGIFHGRYLPEFEQDLFLGIKYAPKPVRFTPP